MGEPAVERRIQTATGSREALESLLTSMASSARYGTSQLLTGTVEARNWTELERGIHAALAERSDASSLAVRDQVARLLARADRSGKRRTDYLGMASELERHANAGNLALPPDLVAHHLHHALLWYSAWHLLAAGVAMHRVVRVMQTRPRQPFGARFAPWIAQAGATLARLRSGSQKLSNRSAALWRESQQRLAAYKAERAVREAQRAEEWRQDRERFRLAEEERAAQQAAAAVSKPAPAAASAEGDGKLTIPTPTAMALDGRRLRGSVMGTWLMLVGLSWVSLIWGALISMPFGVGLAIAGTMVAGFVVVPTWATVWGFFGMGMARDATLREMGFRAADPDSALASVTHKFASELGIPTPQVGTVPVSNAFAMGVNERNATVAIGTPLIASLSAEETAAVIGHELGHIVSGDMRRMMLMRTFQNATVWYGVTQGLKHLARWIICWAAELAILAFSRRREYWADAIGAALAGKEAMIGALRKIDQGPALTSAENTHARFMFRGRAFSTHPSTADRIRTLEQETYIRRLPVMAPRS